MRALVTDGAGFISSHLVDQLITDGHHVAVLDDLSTGHRNRVPSDATLHVVVAIFRGQLTRREIPAGTAIEPAFAPARAGEWRHGALNSAKAGAKLDWTPGTSISASIKEIHQQLTRDS